MMRPSPAEVALWIVQRADASPLVRDLAGSLLAAYIAQLEETNAMLSRELARRPARHLALCPVPGDVGSL